MGFITLIIIAISCVISTLICIFTPNDYWVLAKISKTQYSIFLFCISFVIILLLVVGCNKLRASHKNKLLAKQESTLYKRKLLEKIWKRVDEFRPEEKKTFVAVYKKRK